MRKRREQDKRQFTSRPMPGERERKRSEGERREGKGKRQRREETKLSLRINTRAFLSIFLFASHTIKITLVAVHQVKPVAAEKKNGRVNEHTQE